MKNPMKMDDSHGKSYENGWFLWKILWTWMILMENPMKMDDVLGYLHDSRLQDPPTGISPRFRSRWQTHSSKPTSHANMPPGKGWIISRWYPLVMSRVCEPDSIVIDILWLFPWWFEPSLCGSWPAESAHCERAIHDFKKPLLGMVTSWHWLYRQVYTIRGDWHGWG